MAEMVCADNDCSCFQLLCVPGTRGWQRWQQEAKVQNMQNAEESNRVNSVKVEGIGVTSGFYTLLKLKWRQM
jgi:hypothetical protein